MLLPAERSDLAHLEAVIESGLRTFVEVGRALIEIRARMLYRESFARFEDYCRDRWEMERAHAYRLIQAAEVISNLSPIGDTAPPANEAQARPLTRIAPGMQSEVWRTAVETAPNGQMTARHAERVVTYVRDQMADGIEADEAVRRVSAIIGMPGPALANRLAQETGLSVKASDNTMRDGRTNEAIAVEVDEIQQRHSIYDALMAMATAPLDPAHFAQQVPSYQRFRVDDHLAAALGWLTEFAQEWGTCR